MKKLEVRNRIGSGFDICVLSFGAEQNVINVTCQKLDFSKRRENLEQQFSKMDMNYLIMSDCKSIQMTTREKTENFLDRIIDILIDNLS